MRTSCEWSLSDDKSLSASFPTSLSEAEQIET